MTDAPARAEDVRERLISQISTSPLADIDYVEMLTYPALEPVVNIQDTDAIIIALAVKFGHTRLIDNVIITTKGK